MNATQSDLQLETVGGRREYAPGDSVELEVEWQLLEAADAIEVRLVWYTVGKGDQDISVVEVERFDDPPLYNRRRCTCVLPEAPYSFSGRLISLVWCVELIVLPRGPSRRLDLTVGPDRREVLLESSD
jgi:hypothetical protein